jgi:hypothetical protein
MTSRALILDDLHRVVVSALGKLGMAVPIHHPHVFGERRGDQQVVAFESI